MDAYRKTKIKTNIVTGLFVIVIAAGAVWSYLEMRNRPETKKDKPHDTEFTPPHYAPTTIQNTDFHDGLRMPNSVTEYELDDFGAGTASREIFNRDINGDGRNDRITRTLVENGTSHFYYDYKIEINQNGAMVDVTPPELRTIEGADCALQKIKFVFRPDFRIIKISRPWQDTWATPTMATETVYTIVGNRIGIATERPLKIICDVEELF